MVRVEGNWTCQCVAVNTNQLIIVSEGGNHRISVFTSEGQFVRLFGRQGEKPREFNFPSRDWSVELCTGVTIVTMLKQQHFVNEFHQLVLS